MREKSQHGKQGQVTEDNLPTPQPSANEEAHKSTQEFSNAPNSTEQYKVL